jgi:hypothetical protein
MDAITTKDGIRPGHDELVPSRYALRVGEIDVMVVSDGVLTLPGAMLGHSTSTRPCGRRGSWCVAAAGPYSSMLG